MISVILIYFIYLRLYLDLHGIWLQMRRKRDKRNFVLSVPPYLRIHSSSTTRYPARSASLLIPSHRVHIIPSLTNDNHRLITSTNHYFDLVAFIVRTFLRRLTHHYTKFLNLWRYRQEVTLKSTQRLHPRYQQIAVDSIYTIDD